MNFKLCLKRLICIGAFLNFWFPAFTQDLNWYHRFPCTDLMSLEGMNADTSSNLYISGFFKGNCDFDLGPSEYLLHAEINSHIYVQKMQPDGSLVWARDWGAATLDTTFMVVGFDKYGHTYLEGRFADSIDLDPGPGEYWMEPNLPISTFLLKLDRDGQFIWALQLPLLTIPPVADQDGNLWLAARFNGDLDADPGPGVFLLQASPSVSVPNTALIKLDSSGTFLWAGAIARVGPVAATTDLKGNFYLRGSFGGAVDLDPGPGVFELTSDLGAGEDDLNLKLNPDGAFLWGKYTARPTKSFSALYFGGMEVDAQEQVYLSTQIIGGYDVDPGVGELIFDAQQNDIVVMKLDSMGNLAWADHIKNPSAQTVLDLKLDAAGNSYVTGYLSNDVDMDPGPGVALSPDNRGGDFDAYLLKLDSAGNFNWVTRYGGKKGEWGAHIAVDGKGRVTAGGPSSGIMDFGNLSGEDFIPAAPKNTSFFLAQVNQDGRYSGTVFSDLNHNQIQDLGEPGVPNLVLDAGQQRFTSTNADGQYRFTREIGGDTLRVSKLRPYWQVEPDFALPDTLHLVNDFTFTQPDTVRDVALEIVSVSSFRPGFPAYVWMALHNLGTTLIDSVRVSLDSFNLNPALSVTLSFPSPQVQDAGHLEWHIYQLEPGANVPIRVWFYTPDTVSLDTPIDFPITAALPGDLDTSNNYRRLQTEVMGSFDPNDKRVMPERLSESTLEDASLQYLIRFQNTGNLPAEFVILRDTLPPTVDLGSLEILGASHAYTWRLRDAGILEIHFNQINLPDSLSDPQGSQGFAVFRIRPIRSLQTGDSVINRAGIYFDYNLPVITQAAITILTKTNAIPVVEGPDNTLSFNLLPNPAASQSLVTLSLSDAHSGAQVQLADLHGRIIFKQRIPANVFSVQLPGLQAGWYSVHVQTGVQSGTRLLLVE